jgi:hypothetical protein
MFCEFEEFLFKCEEFPGSQKPGQERVAVVNVFCAFF